MIINQNTNFTTHNTSARNGSIKYIVIHYVGATGDAKANITYYNQKNVTSASADFYVGHTGDIWQYNPNPKARYCWAVGGKKQSSHGGKFYGIAKNANCISIEMCVKNNGNKAANSPDWSLSDATYASAVELTKHLMKQYNIDINHVIRHFDVNGKACPGIIGWNTYPGNNENKWLQFKNHLASTETTSTDTYKYKVGDKVAVSSHYVGANDYFDKAVAVNPHLPMQIIGIVKGAQNPYHTNYNTYCNDGDIRGYAAAQSSNTAASVTPTAAQSEPKYEYNQNIKDLQWALNQDGFTDANEHTLSVDGIWGCKTASAVAKVLLSAMTSGRYTNVTSWVQCRVGTNPDGYFGIKTRKCVMEFQKSHRLTDDGIVGKKTMMALIIIYVPNAE